MTRGAAALVCLLALVGCEAVFDDLRPAAPPLTESDAGMLVLGDEGVVGVPDAGPLDPTTDAGPDLMPDAGSPVGDGGVISTGMWEGRTGYTASGGATLERDPDGTLVVRFGDDFVSQRVPGPVVVISRRPSIGRNLDEAAGDVNLGVLESITGAQEYAVPPGSEDAQYVWVYCLPFRVEVARAELLPGAG